MRIRVKWSSALALGGMLFAAPAVAADAANSPPEYSWTGFYIGVAAGYGWGDTRMTDKGAMPPAIPWSNAFGISGGLIGVTAGANIDIGPLVAGIEGDISAAGVAGTFGPGVLGTVGLAPGTGWNCQPGACFTEITSLGTIRGRLGYAAGPVLIYGTGGAAFGTVNAGIQGNAPYAGSWTQTGWIAGAGIEAMIGADWTAKVEYLYVDLGWTSPVGTEAFQAYANTNIVRFGLNRQFK